MRRAASIAALILLARPVFSAPLDEFRKAFGTDGLRGLEDGGAIVITGSEGGRRLAGVHWKELETLVATASSCRDFARAVAAAPATTPDLGLESCRGLPDRGPMTHRLHALAAALEAESEDRWSLKSSSASAELPPKVQNFFESPLGRDWAGKRRADRREDFSPLVKPYFDEAFADFAPNLSAAKLFETATASAPVSVSATKIADDARAGVASEATREAVRRYLLDDRERLGLRRAAEKARALAKDAQTVRDLAALDAIATAFLANETLLAELKAAVAAERPRGGAPRLLSAGFHLQEPTRLARREFGDPATVSGAYWVDGLAEDATIEVLETTFLEFENGFASVQSRSVKRGNGGPYPFERRVTVDDPHSFAVHADVAASTGTIIVERTAVPVSAIFSGALAAEAEALNLEASCDPRAAAAGFTALVQGVSAAANIKPQYRALEERSREGLRRTAAEIKTLAAFEEAAKLSAPDSSSTQCRYVTTRVDGAIQLERGLPAGCGKTLPELFARRALILRRADDQAWFTKASAQARSRRRSCHLEEAAAGWTDALTVLETDAAARCGDVDAEASRAESELAKTRRTLEWMRALTRVIKKAENDPSPARRLELLEPAIARLASIDGRECATDLLARARKAAEAAGAALPAPTDAASRWPKDADLQQVVGEVRHERLGAAAASSATNAPAAVPAPTAVKAPKKSPPAKRANQK